MVEGLEFPAGIAFLSDDTMVVTERSGRVRLVEDGRLLPEPLAEIPTVTQGETGLLGVAVHPDGGSIYAFATEPDGSSNSVWRVPLDGGSPERVVEGLPAALYHNGGGVAFGPDDMLYVSNGERHDRGLSQDPQALGGKVYRFAPDGSIPNDNPFGDSPTFALGLRNPFGLTVDPVSGDLWVTENGPESFDEINHIREGENYGWPDVSGPGCDESCIDPVLAYRSIIVPTGITFAERGSRDLFFGTFGEGSIHRVRLNEARTEAVADEIVVRDGPIVAVAWGPEGLYYSTPEAVKVVEIAAGDGDRDDASDATPSPEDGAPTEDAGVAGSERGDGDEGLSLPLIVVGALLLGGLALLMLRLRRALPPEETEGDR